LAIGFIVLVIFFSILVFYGILILRDLSKVTDEVEELVTRVHKTIIQPLRAVDYLVEKITPYVESIIESKLSEKKKKK
jgi:hypothetical protein